MRPLQSVTIDHLQHYRKKIVMAIGRAGFNLYLAFLLRMPLVRYNFNITTVILRANPKGEGGEVCSRAISGTFKSSIVGARSDLK